MEWQPRWVAYAAHEGRTPDEQAAHDRNSHGAFLSHRFMSWIDAAWGAWTTETGRRPTGLTEADHDAFDAWLPSYRAAAADLDQEARHG